jgi:holo-[acyl-carrier protein] synthase
LTRSIGIDMADVQEVGDSIRRHGERYLGRVYTDGERRVWGTSARRLTQCFAIKEATIKALACPERPPWHSVDVGRDSVGRPVVALSGPAAERARELGIHALAVTVSGAAGHALAVVLATSGG